MDWDHYPAMGMVKRNHELVESGAYTYGFSPEVDAWREVAEYRDSESSTSISIEALKLGEDFDPSVKLAGEPVMEDLVSSLLGLLLSSGPKPPVRFSPIIPTVGALQHLVLSVQEATGEVRIGGVRDDIMVEVAAPLAAQNSFEARESHVDQTQFWVGA
ncbi:hypothetical protein AYI68_g6474 [Smittium mucronatum]|uniref:Uncharacterized protein n=1 Tax=Smittium mucronatum TaxID=133383 RepID=A0A1R0GRC9_9FUNG|nr:hypothetical protein AYI68_g6474 [Smittium mucronatum]